MPDLDIVEYYDRVIFDALHRAYWGRLEFYNVGLWSATTPNQMDACINLVDRVLSSSSSPSRVLDVGCGLGATTQQARQRWPLADVHGVNISPIQIEHCRQNISGCHFHAMDATKLDFPDESFDLVFSIEAAFHFNTRHDFFKEALRILKPGGILALADIIVEDNQYADRLYLWDVKAANCLDNLQAYAEVLKSTGFDSIKLEDITSNSWMTWCTSIEKWLLSQSDNQIITKKQKDAWQMSLPLLRKVVRHYLIAIAEKPIQVS